MGTQSDGLGEIEIFYLFQSPSFYLFQSFYFKQGCDDADRCKELDNIKEDSNYKGGTDRVNSVEIKEKDIKNHEKKLIITKRRQKEKASSNLNFLNHHS